jgi:tetratricopeptide (TPR) repeat protein
MRLSREDQTCARKCSYTITLTVLDELSSQAADDDRKWLFLAKSGLFIRAGDFNQAVNFARRSTLIDDRFSPGYFNWVNGLFGLEKNDTAVDVAKVWVTKAPKESYSLRISRSGLAGSKRYQEAQEVFEQAIEAAPERSVLYVLLGNVLVKRMKDPPDKIEWRAAEAKYKKAAEIDS